MNEDLQLYQLEDDAGVHREMIVDLPHLAETLHSWYVGPGHPDVVDHPEARETIVHAHRTIDELVTRLRRGEPVDDLAADLDVTIRPFLGAVRISA